MKTLAMTIYDRTPEIISAVMASLRFPGNRPDEILVCYDRASRESKAAMQKECDALEIELRTTSIDSDFVGPRCPSLAWNTVIAMSENSHTLCISSDVVLAPHSIAMAYHLSEAVPEALIVGRAEHSGTSYNWTHTCIAKNEETIDRSMTSAHSPSPLGFVWLIPMETFKRVGGYNEDYMDGLCYEDSDFAIRMWHSGIDFIFCDDIIGFHMEHKRDHLKNADGRVSISEKRFVDTYGDADYLRKEKFFHNTAEIGTGMAIWSHSRDIEMLQRLVDQQRLYGQGEPWQAIPVDIVNECDE